jgi:hypothetical protein
MALLLPALALWPPPAAADPPVLQSVTVPLGGNHPTSTWTLPAGVSSQFIQTSTSSEVTVDGYFRSVESFDVLEAGQTVFTDPFNFPRGVYYVHVAGHDQKCTRGACPPIQFSEIMTFEVPGVGSGPGGALPSTSGGPGPDRVKPLQTLSFAAIQDVDRLFVKARMSEAGTLAARGTVRVPGASKAYRFRRVSRSVAGNKLAKLRLKLAKKPLKAVKRALKKRKRLKATVTVTATDRARNKSSQRGTIRLRD